MGKMDTTRKMSAVPAMNEQEYAEWAYNEAKKAMLANPTKENVDAFTEANKRLFETQDAYRIGARLMLERAQQLYQSARSLFGR